MYSAKKGTLHLHEANFDNDTSKVSKLAPQRYTVHFFVHWHSYTYSAKKITLYLMNQCLTTAWHAIKPQIDYAALKMAFEIIFSQEIGILYTSRNILCISFYWTHFVLLIIWYMFSFWRFNWFCTRFSQIFYTNYFKNAYWIVWSSIGISNINAVAILFPYRQNYE